MLKKLMPIVLLLIGSGAGVGAGIFLRPAPAETGEEHAGASIAEEGGGAKSDSDAKGGGEGEHEDGHGSSKEGHSDSDDDEEPSEFEYVKLNNQFVVPIVKHDNVASLIVIALSLETPAGNKDEVFRREPKVRDSFLQVLFDHANVGGFDGAFTEASMLDNLRRALREVAQRDLGRDMVSDVLILEIARQDY